jgi:phosphoglycerol transferase MdoB-like AlkP superfamily enzyme
MGAVQTPQSRAALSLLAVLVAAKAMMLAGQRAPVSAWMPFAYFWQDVLVALLFGAAVRLVGRPAVTWTCYVGLSAYVAINVPVSFELSSPMSIPMLRAARAPWADSIASGLTMRKVMSVAAVLLVAAVAPWLVTRLRAHSGQRAGIAAVAWVAIGVAIMPRVDTYGLHRNAIGALLPAAVPLAASGSAPADWRASPFDAPLGLDLRHLRDAARGSNVLLVTLESTAARYLGLYGASRDPMPTLTQLAGRSMVFNRVYAAYPESIKGLFATLCSRAPVYGTSAEDYDRIPCGSIAHAFKSAGYRTSLFHSGRFDYLGMRAVIDGRGFDVLEDAGAMGAGTDSSFGVEEDAAIDRMLAWIDGLAPADRFFLTYLPVKGHHPYATVGPGPFTERSEFGQYLNALHESDVSLGRLLEGLKARRRDRDTLIVITADHGEAFGQHEGNRGHSLFIYDENVRVPFLIAMAGWGEDAASAAGQRIDRVGSLVDIGPTILDLVSLPRPALEQGVSLLEPAPRLALFFGYSLGGSASRRLLKYLFQVESRGHSTTCAPIGRGLIDSSTQIGSAYRDRLEGWTAWGGTTFGKSSQKSKSEVSKATAGNFTQWF